MERFTYTVSHDLKSPLVTLKSFLGYLEEDLRKADEGRVARDLDYLRGAAGQMGDLLDDLLEMSRVGRVANRPELLTAREVVEQALTAVAGPLAERGVAVRAFEQHVPLLGDPARLREVWQNLIENAVKFLGDQPHPEIEVSVALDDRNTVFSVCDNGIGVPEAYHDQIFSLFEKLDRSSEGTGLGLALARRIVELYGGTIWVESPRPGGGSCFRFTLPDAIRVDQEGRRER